MKKKMAITEYLESDLNNNCYFKNDFNSFLLKNFKKVYIDLLMIIINRINKLKEDEYTIEITVKEVIDLINEATESKYRPSNYYGIICNFCTSVMGSDVVKFESEDRNEFEIVHLFNKCYMKDSIVHIDVNQNYKYLFKDFSEKFTSVKLYDILSFRSKYTKLLYLHIKQWGGKGLYKVSADDFRKILSIPGSYSESDIDERIIRQAIKEIRNIPGFSMLKCSKTHQSKPGRPVKEYFFRWTYKDMSEDVNDTVDKISISADDYQELYSKKVKAVMEMNISVKEKITLITNLKDDLHRKYLTGVNMIEIMNIEESIDKTYDLQKLEDISELPFE